MKTADTCVKGLSIAVLERMGDVLKLLAHPYRLKIIEILENSEGVSVHEIAERLRLPHAATSQHLNRMRRMGVVAAERHGKEVFYRISDKRSISILNCVRSKAGTV